MTAFRTLDDLGDIAGQVALVRIDLNLPMQDGAVTDDTRVRASAPTITELADRGAKVLLHCSNGNRAAAAICPWLVLDKGMPVEEALRIAKLAGLQLPETEAAVRGYIASKGRA